MKTVVVTSFDANYLQYSYVFVKTLSENYHGSKKLDLYCLVPEDVLSMESLFVENLGDVSNLNIKFVCSDKFSRFSTNEKVRGSEWISKNAWHRIFIPSVCNDFDRAIYIDSDTMIMRDIDPLINFDLTNKFAAFIENNFNSADRVFGNPDQIYFNAGVFVADLNYWRSLNLEEKIMNDVLDGGVTLMLEQDRLNLAFNNVFQPLPITFNYPAYYEDSWQVAITNPLVVHFFGPNKPWKYSDTTLPLALKWRTKHYMITKIQLEQTESYYAKGEIHD